MKNIQNYNKNIFESIKHIDEEGNEYWYARELMKTLEYGEYRYFLPVIKKAMFSCKESKYNISDHFVHVHDMIKIGKGAKRKVDNYKLSRYACYLIAMNGDSRKEVIALAQTYFAYQTRKQELLEEEFKELSEDEKRIIMRRKVKSSNYNLNNTASKSGVKNFGEFHNAGYKGLYGGETADNLFRIVQTDSKLKKDRVDNEYTANSVHFEVGKKVRQTIKELGGTMPENLPTPNKSINELEDNDNYDIIR